MGFSYTPTLRILRGLNKRTKVIAGSTSAGKTYAILAILIDRAVKNPNKEIHVVAESLPKLRRGAILDFQKIMIATNRWFPEKWNATMSTYTFSSGSKVSFFSVENAEQVLGIRRDILFINESTSIKWNTFFQMSLRTNDEIWIDLNPSSPDTWALAEVCKKDEKGELLDPDVDQARITYRENTSLNPMIVSELEKVRARAYYDPLLPVEEDGRLGTLFHPSNVRDEAKHQFWVVFGEGFSGSFTGQIYTNWEVIPSVPQGAKFLGLGLDWGFTNDPSACVSLWKIGDEYVVREEIYETGLLVKDVADRLQRLGYDSGDLIICDSAEPKSIAELRSLGFKGARPAKKGRDSVNNGIQLVQGLKLKVTEESVNVIKEFRNYMWLENKEGKQTNKPMDNYNHSCDALRYLAMRVCEKRKGFIVSQGKVLT